MSQVADAAASARTPGRADPEYTYGVLLVALAGVFWSTGGLLVRWIDAADAWQIIFYRSLSLALTLLLIVAVRHRGRLVRAFASAGWNGLPGGGLPFGRLHRLHPVAGAHERRQCRLHARHGTVLRGDPGARLSRRAGPAVELARHGAGPLRHRRDGRRQPGDRHDRGQPSGARREPLVRRLQRAGAPRAAPTTCCPAW